jgi:predicted 3-demethylubiquinone-9 3-methyltransferase (glyoxalase superfamily)
MINKSLSNRLNESFQMKIIIPVYLLSLIAISCTDLKGDQNQRAEIETLQSENYNLQQIINENESAMGQQIITFLTFQKNDAEPAMEFYISLFENSRILDIQRWGKDGPGKEGTIMHATFELNGQKFMCSDSPPVHNWDFTPAVSNFVECKNEEELNRLFSKLSENGAVAMPLDNYGFSQKFGWVVDRFGVSWQLNLQ